MAQLEAGSTTRQNAAVDFNELVANVLHRAADRTRGREVVVNIDPALPPVSGDERALAEALYNLVDNAAKYSPDGSTIRISGAKAAGAVRIEVEDEGKGVRASERDRIFEKFHRGDKSVKGFGLGLAIVRGIVEAHGGRVFVEDGDHGGSRFVIELKD